ncbi:MAG: SNF2-related protein [Propionicimonas sp.]
MSEGPDRHAWLAELTEVRLLTVFGPNAVSAGQRYAAMGRVGRIAAGGAEADQVLQANVRGSGRHSYQTVVRISRNGAIGSFCSCPVRTNCKHGVAVLWAYRASQLEPAPPPWQRALAQFAERDRRSGTPGQPLALQFLRWAGNPVQLRVLTLGKRGGWVRTGIDWDGVEGEWETTFDATQRRVLGALRRAHRAPSGYGYYGRTELLVLDDFGAEVWQLLGQAEAAGVTFIGGELAKSVRLLSEPARMVSVLRPAEGGAELVSRLVAEAQEWEVGAGGLVGDPAHGVALMAEGELVLGALARPLETSARTLLVRHPRLEIPAVDLPSFTAGFLPALRRSFDLKLDPALELPEVAPPTLLLRVEFGAGHSTRLRWGFRYRVGDEVFDVRPEPAPGDPPVRDGEAEAGLLASLPAEPWAVATDQLARVRLVPETLLRGAESAAFVTDWLAVLQRSAAIEVELSEAAPSYRRAESAPVVSVAMGDDAGGATDWFDLAVTVEVDGEQVEFRELFAALARGESHLILDSGTWFSLDRPELEQLRRIIDEAMLLQPDAAGGLRLRREHAGLWQELVDLGVVAEQSRAWQAAVSALLDVTELPAVDVPEGLQASLRGYQKLGYRWLRYLWRAGLGGILADDMGLGKTLQVLSAVLAAAEDGELGDPVLVVAPTSVVGTWAGEAARFAPGLRVRTIEATAGKRSSSLAELRTGADLLVTSYTLLRLDDADYAQYPWAAVVLDEAQFVKNRATRAYKAVRRLSAPVKLAATGTPLENNLMDLWSLLSITAPGLFADPEVFAELYRRPIESGRDPEALARLHRRVRPLMLRRTKQAVAPELPPKQEQVLEVALSPGHRRIYDRHLAAERKRVLRLVDDLDRNRVAILRSLTLLRQLSLSPALVEAGAPEQSAKIDTLVELVTELAAEGHRALVFSQFTGFLKLVRERLDAERIGYAYLDGRTRDRQRRIAEFRESTDPVFLISLKAGGFGLTLTEADYVFILDPWWNPAAETQAIDRTHRIGQDKPVNVYRLVSADTIEQKVVALQQRKRELFDSVMGAGTDAPAPLTAADIRGLLDLG